MLITLAFFSGDKAQAIRLSEWIRDLGGVKSHDCLLAVYKDTDSSGVIETLREAFGRVAEFPITDDMIQSRAMYQYCGNISWKRCAQHVAEMNESQPWLFLESDAVPICPEWLDTIAADYLAGGKPFMLDRVVTKTSVHNSGIGVYPARVRDYTMRLWELANDPWDVFLAPDFAPHTHHGKAIHDNAAMSPDPTFHDAASLSVIRDGAVLFHRDKSGELIERLREARGGVIAARPSHRVEASGANPVPATERAEGLRLIYAYHEPLGEKWDDPELTELCRESWRRQGWHLVILTGADARKHPRHDLLLSQESLHSKGDLRDYINACYRRWLAFAMVARNQRDIWTCDLDTINYGFTAAQASSIPLRETITLCNDSPTPCLTHGSAIQYEAIIDEFLSFAEAPHTSTSALVESISDQNILDARRDAWTGLPLVTEYLQPGCEKAALVHFAFARLYFPGKRGAKIKEIRPLEPAMMELVESPAYAAASHELRNGCLVSRSDEERGIIQKSISEQIREHCSALAALIEERPTRKQKIQETLRKAGIVGSAKKRKASKAGRKLAAV